MSNSNNIDLVKRLNKACETKDFATARTLIHPNYTLKDPQMSINGVDEFIEFMENCPSDGKMENVRFISDSDNKVVQVLDCVATKPVAFRFTMCDILTIKDGQIISEETFYDTAQIPQEAKNAAPKTSKKHAA